MGKKVYILAVLILMIVNVSAQLNYDNPFLPKITSTAPTTTTTTSSGNGSGINQSFADATYLRLDTLNDPLLGNLNMGGKNIESAGTITAQIVNVSSSVDFITGAVINFFALSGTQVGLINFVGTSFGFRAVNGVNFQFEADNGAFIVFNSLRTTTSTYIGSLPDAFSFFVDGSTGNVGVGTSTPSAKLNVLGSFNVTGNASIGGTSLKVNGKEVCLNDSTNCQNNGDITSVQGDGYITNGSNAGAVTLLFNTTLNNQSIVSVGLANGFNVTFNATYNNILNQNCPSGQAVNGTLANGTLICTTVTSSGGFTTDQNNQLNTTGSPSFVNLTLTGNLSVGEKIIYSSGIIIGDGTTIGSNTNCTAIGKAAICSANDAITIGRNARIIATGTGSILIGQSASTTQTTSITIGSGANTTGASAIAIGTSTKSSSGVTIGNQALGNASGCVAIGTSASCSGANSFAMARFAVATGSGSVAVGTSANALNVNAISFGASSIVRGDSSIIVGSLSEVNGTNTTLIGNSKNYNVNNTILLWNRNLAVDNSTNSVLSTCTMVAGACTISNTQVKSDTAIMCTPQNQGTAIGSVRVGVKNAGVNFTIVSSNILDDAQVDCILFQRGA